MLVILVKFLLPAIILFFLFRKILGKEDRKSKFTLLLLILSIVFNTALAQNYTYNLIPIPYPERDGISISNWLAYYVFGDDHFGHWSLELFRAGYEISINVSMALLVIYLVCLAVEHRKTGKE